MSKRNYGEGTIYKKNGKYSGQITIGRKPDGKLNRKTVYGKTIKEVRQKFDEIKKNLLIGQYVEPDKTTVDEWIKCWLESYKKICIKPRTYDSYEQLLELYIEPGIGNIVLQELNPRKIQAMYNKLYADEISANTLRKVQNVLKPALKQAVIDSIIAKNPAENVHLPDIIKKDIKVFEQDDQDNFEVCAKNYRLYNAFIFNLDTGLRTSEILPLTWDDIDLDNKTVDINKDLVNVKDRKNGGYKLLVQDTPKTVNGRRTIPLTTRLVNMLTEIKTKKQLMSDIIFCNEKGNYVTPRNYSRTFSKVIKKAKIGKCGPHTMRHTFATKLFKNGVAPKTISKLLGHKSVAFTLDTYTHILADMERGAIDTLDDYL